MQNLPQKSGEQKFMDDILNRALTSKIITPKNYALENAVKSAYLLLYQKDFLKKCTRDSIDNAVLDMIVQGLNPIKDQCYFIAYGNILKCMRSYLGSIAVAKRFDANIKKINAEVFYVGDELEYDIKFGVKCNIRHRQNISNLNNKKIVGAYATSIDHEGYEIMSDIMVWSEILESWSRSQKTGEGQPIINGELNPKSDHAKHPSRFSRRTVINRICKVLISATDDHVLMKSYNRSAEELDEKEAIQIEVNENANKKLIDFPVQTTEIIEIKSEDVEDMATEQQIKKLYAIEKSNNRADDILKNVGSFINRKIAGLSELTRAEIESYMDMLEDERRNAGGPDWK